MPRTLALRDRDRKLLETYWLVEPPSFRVSEGPCLKKKLKSGGGLRDGSILGADAALIGDPNFILSKGIR